MCVIIVKPKGKTIEEYIMRNGWHINSDGAGFCYVHNRKLIVHKELKSINAFIDKYNQDIVDTGLEKDKHIIMHFRFKTHGLVSEDNIHPFYIENHNMAFAHNGTIYHHTKDTNDKSDTLQFKETILDNLPPKWYNYEATLIMMKEYVSANRLAFMTPRGEVIIINEKGGKWYDGLWYSNERHDYWDKEMRFPKQLPAKSSWNGGWGFRENIHNLYIDGYDDEYDEYEKAYPQTKVETSSVDELLFKFDPNQKLKTGIRRDDGSYEVIPSVHEVKSIKQHSMKILHGMYVIDDLDVAKDAVITGEIVDTNIIKYMVVNFKDKSRCTRCGVSLYSDEQQDIEICQQCEKIYMYNLEANIMPIQKSFKQLQPVLGDSN